MQDVRGRGPEPNTTRVGSSGEGRQLDYLEKVRLKDDAKGRKGGETGRATRNSRRLCRRCPGNVNVKRGDPRKKVCLEVRFQGRGPLWSLETRNQRGRYFSPTTTRDEVQRRDP